MNLFWNIDDGEEINDYANFRSFGASLLTLLISATGEKWNGFMHDISVQPPGMPYLVLCIASLSVLFGPFFLSSVIFLRLWMISSCSIFSSTTSYIFTLFPLDCSREEGNCGSSWAKLYFVSYVKCRGIKFQNEFLPSSQYFSS